MRALIQRVDRAAVRVGGQLVGQIAGGLLVFVGVTHGDNAQGAQTLARKVYELRILDSETSVGEVAGAEILVVSQFTLYGDARKGRRPSWAAAAPASVAEPLVAEFVGSLRARNALVQTGIFGADMSVELVNSGPMTVLLEI